MNSAGAAKPPSGARAISERRSELGRRAADLLRMTDELAEADRDVDPEAIGDLRALDGHLAIRSGELRDLLLSGDSGTAGAHLHRISLALADVQTLRFEIRDLLVHERLHRLEALEAGLVRLRRLHDPDTLLREVCAAVVDACGFERVMLSRVEGSTWRPWRSFAVGQRDSETQFRNWLAKVPEIPLERMLLEAEMVRQRDAALIADVHSDPRVSPLLRQVAVQKSYVAAPLMPEGRVVGFLHADYRDTAVTPLDRDVLAVFARAFDQIFERAVLLQRLQQQRDQMRATIESVSGMLDGLASSEIELVRSGSASAWSAPRSSRPGPASSGSRLAEVLTKRELEVLTLLSTGATNDRIAERLVISTDTVKSHVKHILRKLRAENRAEAIAQYLRITLEREA